jgi:glycerol-3-phosphate acyltransferase PlsY
MTAAITLMTRMPWPAAVAVVTLSIFCICLFVCLRHREQIKRHRYEHDERMKALERAPRSQIAEVVGKFGGD